MNGKVPDLFEIDIAVLSETGTFCSHNEDHCGKYLSSVTSGLIAVADGMTTTEGGEIASQRAILALLRTYRELPVGMPQTQRLVRAARSANYDVRETALTVPLLAGMSTTLTAVAVTSGQMTAAHVGNGRVYLLRDREIVQLSKDHTVAAEAAAEGNTQPIEDGDRLTRRLGSELVLPIDLFEIDLAQNDVVVICTDGLHRVLDDARIAALAAVPGAAVACSSLLDEANRMGTPDNLSVGILHVKGETPRT
jgi:serine/threonine protein phosphatase PrpC